MKEKLFTKSEILRTIQSCFRLLERKDRFLLVASAILQMALVILDLVGVLLIGGIVAVATSAIQGKPLPQVITSVLEITNLVNLTPQEVAKVFGVIATVSLLGKSFLSYYLNYRNLRFLASREAIIASRMADKIFLQPITVLQKFNTTEYQHSLGVGVNSATAGILSGLISLLSEIFLQIIMASTLLIFSPALLMLFLGYFGGLFLLLNFILGRKAKYWGAESTRISIGASRSIADSLGSYREIVVSGRRDFFLKQFKDAKFEQRIFGVKNAMLGQFSKYVFENSVIIGGVLFAAYSFITRPALEAASLLTIFVAAASRIAPSILKIQLGILLMKGAIGATGKFFEIYAHLETSVRTRPQVESKKERIQEELGIVLKNINFTYPGSSRPALENINCTFPVRQFNAVVGPSGSGKSTLIDLILGVLEPNSGSVSVFGATPPVKPTTEFSIGYVPQSVYLTDGSIVENICFGISREEYSEDRVREVLDQVLLSQWVNELPDGIETLVGERGTRISGGQRQRIGIARALYARPKLLVLDEATSALDSISEHEITETIRNIGQELTTIVIAHRLSTVLRAHHLIYLDRGIIKGSGTFAELRASIPNFDKQAQLMGISTGSIDA